MSSWQILKKSFKDFYKHVFLLGGVSLIWFFTVIPLMYVGLGGVFLKEPLPIIMNLIFVGPLTLAAFWLTNGLLEFQELNLKDYFRGFANHFFRGMFAYWISLALMILLVIDLLFFINYGNKVLLYLSGIWIYLIVYFIMSQFYFWSLLVQTDDSLFQVFKKSLLLVLDNLVYSLGIFLGFLLVLLVGLLTAGIALAVSYIGILGILSNNTTCNLLVKYGLREEVSPLYKLE